MLRLVLEQLHKCYHLWGKVCMVGGQRMSSVLRHAALKMPLSHADRQAYEEASSLSLELQRAVWSRTVDLGL